MSWTTIPLSRTLGIHLKPVFELLVYVLIEAVEFIFVKFIGLKSGYGVLRLWVKTRIRADH